MLSKRQKVPRAQFPAIMHKGHTYHSPHLTLRVFKRAGCVGEPGRFSFVVSGKVAKKATARNKLKRRGYAAIKDIETSEKPCFSHVFFFKKGADGLSYKSAKQEISSLLERADVI